MDWISTGSTEGAEVLYAFASMPQPAQWKLALKTFMPTSVTWERGQPTARKQQARV